MPSLFVSITISSHLNAPQSLQAEETNVHKYKRRFYTIDGRIRI